MGDILYELGITKEDFADVEDADYDLDEIIGEVKSWD